MADTLPRFERFGASLIAITPQRPDRSKAQLAKTDYPFPVLSDLDDSVMRAYKLYFRVPKPLSELYRTKFGLDIEAYNGAGRNVLPVPGTFVIDRTGTVRAMHADTDYKQRMEPADVLKALETLAE